MKGFGKAVDEDPLFAKRTQIGAARKAAGGPSRGGGAAAVGPRGTLSRGEEAERRIQAGGSFSPAQLQTRLPPRRAVYLPSRMPRMKHRFMLRCACSTLALLALASGAASALDWQQAGPHVRSAAVSVAENAPPGFTLMPPEQTGVFFTNVLAEERGLTNQIYLNGSGVALGDVDGDGWVDIYLCGTDSPNRLFRNLGNWKFEDITARAGLAIMNQASTGAVFADVDGDGHLDLLVTGLGHGARLFLNDGHAHFREATAEAGLGGTHASTSLTLAPSVPA